MMSPASDRLIIFAHGRDSSPWGLKISHLAPVAESQGYQVMAPDFSDLQDPEARVSRLIKLHPRADRLVLVGSSMGAYVTIAASRVLRPAGLFLMAPAVYLPGYPDQDPVPHADETEIVHGWEDDIVPVDNAIRFARTHSVHLPLRLHLLPDGHALESSIPDLTAILRAFLCRLKR